METASPLVRRLDRLRTPLRIGYVVVLLLATLSSLRLDLDGARIVERMGRMVRPYVSASDAVDAARNLTLFAGWGLVWMITAAPGRTVVAIRNATLTGAAISLAVESAQLLSSTRRASVLDLATNTGGALIGALVLVLMVIATARQRDARSFLGVPASLFAASYGVAILAETIVPLLRQEVPPGVFGGPASRFRGTVEGFELTPLLEVPVGDLLLFLPMGVLGVAALNERGRSYAASARMVAVCGLVSLPLLEIAHGALGMEINVGAAVVHVLAVVLGAALAVRVLPPFTRTLRGPARPAAFTLCYAPLLLLWFWRPYQVEISGALILDKITGEWWIPLAALGGRMDVFSVIDVLAGFFLFLPVGAVLAVWPLKLKGAMSGVRPALAFIVATEAMQTFVAYRWPDSTDVLVQSAGVLIGWLVVRRAGFQVYGEQLGGGG